MHKLIIVAMSGDKMDEDWSDAVDNALPEAENLAKAGNLQDSLEKLLAVEKSARLAGDSPSTSRLLVSMVRLCKEFGSWTQLCEYIMLLSKRRGQLKKAVTAMVDEAMTYIPSSPDEESKMKIVNVLRSVCEGKIHLELQRADLTRELARMKDASGDVSGAIDVLEEVQVETIGSMDKREKVEYILEQMRLTMKKGDYERAQIISRKITAKSLLDEEIQDLKLRYYEGLKSILEMRKQYFSIAQALQSIYETPLVKDDKEKSKSVLQDMIMFLALSTYDEEQQRMLLYLQQDGNMESLPWCLEVAKKITGSALIDSEHFLENVVSSFSSSSVFSPEVKNERIDDLRTRIIEHNIRSIGKFFSRLTLGRLSELLAVPVDKAEEHLARMVSEKEVYARIHRPDGVVVFVPPKTASGTLNEWSENVSSVLNLVERCTHLIHREYLIHKGK